MSQNYTWPSVSVTATNPSVAPNGQMPSATSSTLVAGQKPDGSQEPLQTDSSGNLLVNLASPASPLNVTIVNPKGSQSIANSVAVTDATVVSRLSGSLTPVAYDEIVITYVGATTRIDTVTYKLLGSTVKTITNTYDGSDRLIDVVAT